MPIDAKEFLDAAETLAKSSNTEAYARTSISRSYYCMYHKVLSILDSKPMSYDGKGCHASLIDYLANGTRGIEKHDARELRKLSYMLRQEKDTRVAADYKLDMELTPAHAEQSLKTAKRCFDMCESLVA
ncbi:HEPN domain-containing protein [Enterovibrio norvegicus]|uniref:HEPN domain-containing protein n=1 Tax=Enterovibrio norvegicus TaxID=188144 RepID=UPI000C81783D|nr:HEPN domain-containing protein [Enterovibrio norvegicus]PMH60049.1 hypothetical protein BCU62_21755 [Enterovibrio norvegicus]